MQSDMESASEFEFDGGSGGGMANAQLDLFSKEQLHQAYKSALERYQKYRNRYTEVARRYRDLERDNSKARVSDKMTNCHSHSDCKFPFLFLICSLCWSRPKIKPYDVSVN